MESLITKEKKKAENFEKLKLFSEKSEPENILKIVESDNFTFVITIKTNHDYCARLSKFQYNGYWLEKDTNNVKSIAFLRCEVHNKKISDNIEYIHHIYIQDFFVDKPYRKNGYGTILLNELIEYAKKLQVHYISGKLSFRDIGTEGNRTQEQAENRKRLYHFYPKNGFIIDEDEMIYLQIHKKQE